MNLNLFIINLFIPFIMIFVGLFFYKKNYTKIDYLVGFKTKASKASLAKYSFANKYFGKCLFKSSFLIIAIVFIMYFISNLFNNSNLVFILNILIEIIWFIIVCIITNKKLKRHLLPF